MLKIVQYLILLLLLNSGCKNKSQVKDSTSKKIVYWLETVKGRRISDDITLNENVKIVWTDSLYKKTNFKFKSKKYELFIYGNSKYALGFNKRRKIVLDSIGIIYICVPEIKVFNRLKSNDENFNQLVDKAILEFNKDVNPINPRLN